MDRQAETEMVSREGWRAALAVRKDGPQKMILRVDYGLNICVPRKFIFWNPNLQSSGIWRWCLWEILRSWGWRTRDGSVPLKEETCSHGLWGHIVKMCPSKLGCTSSPGAGSDSDLELLSLQTCGKLMFGSIHPGYRILLQQPNRLKLGSLPELLIFFKNQTS